MKFNVLLFSGVTVFFVLVLTGSGLLVMEKGGFYPEFSTLNSAPSGTRVLYRSLEKTGIRIRRNYDLYKIRPDEKGIHVFLGEHPTKKKPIGTNGNAGQGRKHDYRCSF